MTTVRPPAMAARFRPSAAGIREAKTGSRHVGALFAHIAGISSLGDLTSLHAVHHVARNAGIDAAAPDPLQGSVAPPHPRPRLPAHPSTRGHSVADTRSVPGHESTGVGQGHVWRMCSRQEEGAHLHCVLAEPQAQAGSSLCAPHKALYSVPLSVRAEPQNLALLVGNMPRISSR